MLYLRLAIVTTLFLIAAPPAYAQSSGGFGDILQQAIQDWANQKLQERADKRAQQQADQEAQRQQEQQAAQEAQWQAQQRQQADQEAARQAAEQRRQQQEAQSAAFREQLQQLRLQQQMDLQRIQQQQQQADQDRAWQAEQQAAQEAALRVQQEQQAAQEAAWRVQQEQQAAQQSAQEAAWRAQQAAQEAAWRAQQERQQQELARQQQEQAQAPLLTSAPDSQAPNGFTFGRTNQPDANEQGRRAAQLGVCPNEQPLAPGNPDNFANSSQYTFRPHESGTVSVCQHGQVLWIVGSESAGAYGYQPGVAGGYQGADGQQRYNLPNPVSAQSSAQSAPPPDTFGSMFGSAPVMNVGATPSPAANDYAFRDTASGTVEVYQNGQRVSTGTREYAAQFGYVAPTPLPQTGGWTTQQPAPAPAPQERYASLPVRPAPQSNPANLQTQPLATKPRTDPRAVPGHDVNGNVVSLWSGRRLPNWEAAGAGLTYAMLSDAIYDGKPEADGWAIAETWKHLLGRAYSGVNYAGKVIQLEAMGFDAAIYKKNGQVALAFRGTDGIFALNDDLTDIEQALGVRWGTQYDAAVTIADLASRSYPGEIVATGHSLGGGLAQYVASKNSNMKAVTFNAAGIGGRSVLIPSSKVVNFRIDGDLVSMSGKQLGAYSYTISNPAPMAPRENQLIDQLIHDALSHGVAEVGKTGGMSFVIDAMRIEWANGAYTAIAQGR